MEIKIRKARDRDIPYSVTLVARSNGECAGRCNQFPYPCADRLIGNRRGRERHHATFGKQQDR